MRIVLQRVRSATVSVSNEIIGQIGKGLLLFVGVGKESQLDEIEFLANKSANLRIFEDEKGKMNKSLLDIDGEVLIISQFTLYADSQKGRRPSFSLAAEPDKAKLYYDKFIEKMQKMKIKKIEAGIFAEFMEIKLVNDGPVTLILEDLRCKNTKKSCNSNN